MKSQSVSTSNNYSDKSNRHDTRLEINKKGKGALVHMKPKKNYHDDLFVLESLNSKEMLKIDEEGEVFIKGKNIEELLSHSPKSDQPTNEINLGSWKIISDGENLLIQKLVGDQWITKQHFN